MKSTHLPLLVLQQAKPCIAVCGNAHPMVQVATAKRNVRTQEVIYARVVVSSTVTIV